MRVNALFDVLLDARRLAAADPDLVEEIDGYLARLSQGEVSSGVHVLFLPTGPLQEAALDGGWGDEFLELADRYDAAG